MGNYISTILKIVFLFMVISEAYIIGIRLFQYIYFNVLDKFDPYYGTSEINIIFTSFLAGLISSISGIICCNIFFHRNGTRVFIFIYTVLIVLLFFRYISIYHSIPLHISFWGYEVGILITVASFSLFISSLLTKIKARKLK